MDYEEYYGETYEEYYDDDDYCPESTPSEEEIRDMVEHGVHVELEDGVICAYCEHQIPIVDNIRARAQCHCTERDPEVTMWTYVPWDCKYYHQRQLVFKIKHEEIYTAYEELHTQCAAGLVTAPRSDGDVLCALCGHAEKSRIYTGLKKYRDYKSYCGCEGHEHGGEHWDSYAWWKCTGYVPKEGQ